MILNTLKNTRRLQLFSCLSMMYLFFLSTSTYAVTLDQAIESAISNDPSLHVSKLNQKIAEENITLARARLLPQISLQGSTSKLTQATTQDLPSDGNLARSFTGPSVNHQLVLRQALIRPKDISSLRSAELQMEYMALKYLNDVKELKTRVTIVFIDLLAAQQIAQANERPLPYMHDAVNQERAKFEQGESTSDALVEVQAQYENAKALHLQANALLVAKQILFEKLTKLSAVSLLNKQLSIEPLRIFLDAEKLQVWTTLQERSLEIQMSKLQETMQLEKIKFSQADHKPSLDLVASANVAQNDATSTQGYQYKNRQIGLQYTVPIYLGGAVTAATRQANLGFEASVLDSEIAKTKLENDFENTWSQINGGAIRQKALIDSYFSAIGQLKATMRGLSLGLKSASDVASIELIISRRMVELILNTQEYMKNTAKIQMLDIGIL
jgi:outer membrane protein TolC